MLNFELIKKVKENIGKEVIYDQFESNEILMALKLVNAWDGIVNETLKEKLDKF